MQYQLLTFLHRRGAVQMYLPCYSRGCRKSQWIEAEVCLYFRRVTQELTPWLVGTIMHKADPSEKRSNGPLGVTPPTPTLISSEIEHEAANRMGTPEPRSPSPLEYPPQSVPGCIREASTGVHSTDLRESTMTWRDEIPKPRNLDVGSNSVRDSTQQGTSPNYVIINTGPPPCCGNNCGTLLPFIADGTYNNPNGGVKAFVTFRLAGSPLCGIPVVKVLRGDLEGLIGREELAVLNPRSHSICLRIAVSDPCPVRPPTTQANLY